MASQHLRALGAKGPPETQLGADAVMTARVRHTLRNSREAAQRWDGSLAGSTT